jgi:2-amino-4-hydroxy-6-hydroxymethyldihydropteridine diphosphokinase
LRHSHVIETEPWGVADQPRFLNQVLEVEWQGSSRQLLRAAKAVEREGGRTTTRRWGPRVIDVDILLFGRERFSEPDLQIPHPRIAERPFVLEGLNELGVLPLIRSGGRL